MEVFFKDYFFIFVWSRFHFIFNLYFILILFNLLCRQTWQMIRSNDPPSIRLPSSSWLLELLTLPSSLSPSSANVCFFVFHSPFPPFLPSLPSPPLPPLPPPPSPPSPPSPSLPSLPSLPMFLLLLKVNLDRRAAAITILWVTYHLQHRGIAIPSSSYQRERGRERVGEGEREWMTHLYYEGSHVNKEVLDRFLSFDPEWLIVHLLV